MYCCMLGLIPFFKRISKIGINKLMPTISIKELINPKQKNKKNFFLLNLFKKFKYSVIYN